MSPKLTEVHCAECSCGHRWSEHKTTANGAAACSHFGCGCRDVVLPLPLIEPHAPSKLTEAQRRALERAATREGGYVCPVGGVHAGAEEMLLRALRTKGFITGEMAPTITDAGRAALRGVS